MILITGASRGIGKYLFEEFQKSGETLQGTYNTTLPSRTAEKYLTKVDISDYKTVKKWIQKIRAEMENITLINCAGINFNSFAHKANIDQWTKVINVNLLGTFNVIHEVLPIMRENNFGRIVNLSSVVAQMLIPGTSAYSASKSGLWGLAKSIGAENAKKGITINNLNLGYFNLGIIEEVPKAHQDFIKQKIPGGEFGQPKDILNAIRFLQENEYVNGASIDINGGIH